MNALSTLLRLARAYADAEGVELKTVSSRVFDDSKKLAAIEAGADIQVGRYERAVQWFSANWPELAAWPPEIARPLVAPAAEAAA